MSIFDYLSPWISTTNRCNLNCGYCFVKQSNIDMGEGTYSTIFSYFKDLLDHQQIEFFRPRLAGGEPLLVFDKWKDSLEEILNRYPKRTQGEILNLIVGKIGISRNNWK